MIFAAKSTEGLIVDRRTSQSSMSSVEEDFFSLRGSSFKLSNRNSRSTSVSAAAAAAATAMYFNEQIAEEPEHEASAYFQNELELEETKDETSLEEYFASFPPSMGCVSIGDVIDAVQTSEKRNLQAS
mmetsp:Transcript_104927/g.146299  ORF Transcript_104927/g.146299 Transcript_104927/m.146299 type:complete len:128 (-) Transcript_104927:358-741(-)